MMTFGGNQTCSNCGGSLTDENIRLALDDAGEDIGILTHEDFDRYSFCCPTYSDEGGCLGYSREDQDKPAYWMFR